MIGYDILPKGGGIVTKGPIELRLHTLEEGEPMYCKFLKYPNDKPLTEVADINGKISEI